MGQAHFHITVKAGVLSSFFSPARNKRQEIEF
jgi:hypothetical protein